MVLDNGSMYLWQWDSGREVILEEKDLQNGATTASLSCNNTDAVICSIERGRVKIPDQLLQHYGALYVYLHMEADGALITVANYSFSVRKRAKPNDYVAPEEILTWHQLDERLSRLEEAGAGGPVPYTIGNGLKLVADGASKTLEVDSADAVEKDNSLPITSAAVYTAVGNIDALLSII